MFVRAAITFGICPHSNFHLFCLSLKYLWNRWTDLRQIHREDVFDPLLKITWMSRLKVKVTKEKKNEKVLSRANIDNALYTAVHADGGLRAVYVW